MSDDVQVTVTHITTADERERVATALGHPFNMRRRTDPQLAQAVLGTLGRKPSIPGKNATGSLAEGLRAAAPTASLRQRVMDFLLRRTPAPRISRRWYLRRAEQRDQNGYPHCVAFTQKHWELAVPTINRRGLDPAEMYRRCKLIDPWPTEDGTSAAAMLAVCQELGIVASHWWWTGPQDDEAARRWALDVGPLWVGLNIPEAFFRTDKEGMVTVEGPFLYGHEMLVIGYDSRKKLWELVNSWGNDRWGLLGRGFVKEEDFWRMMYEGGDLIGVVEARR